MRPDNSLQFVWVLFLVTAAFVSNSAPLLGKAAGMLLRKLQLDIVAGDLCLRDRILCDDTAIVFHFHFEIVVDGLCPPKSRIFAERALRR